MSKKERNAQDAMSIKWDVMPRVGRNAQDLVSEMTNGVMPMSHYLPLDSKFRSQ